MYLSKETCLQCEFHIEERNEVTAPTILRKLADFIELNSLESSLYSILLNDEGIEVYVQPETWLEKDLIYPEGVDREDLFDKWKL